MTKNFYLFTFCFSLATCLGFAQPWTQAPWFPVEKKIDYNFYDLQKAFNAYWQEKQKDEYFKKESEEDEENAEEGMEHFKRWEYFMEPRVYPSGKFPEANILWKQWSWYKSSFSYGKKESIPKKHWSSLGPNGNPADGKYTISAGSGRVNCITFHPLDTNIIWAGAASGGLWKSTDAGNTWSPNSALERFPTISISDIAIDPVNPKIIYLATGDVSGAFSGTHQGYSVGLLKSVDEGKNWIVTGVNSDIQEKKLILHFINWTANEQMTERHPGC